MLGISEPTVRSHLQHIFSKTDTSRQADLLRLLQNSTPPIRATQPAMSAARPANGQARMFACQLTMANEPEQRDRKAAHIIGSDDAAAAADCLTSRVANPGGCHASSCRCATAGRRTRR